MKHNIVKTNERWKKADDMKIEQVKNALIQFEIAFIQFEIIKQRGNENKEENMNQLINLQKILVVAKQHFQMI